MSLAAGIANRFYLAAAIQPRARLERALRDPAVAQRAILRRILHQNAGSEFGREHHFDRIRTLAEFQARVPARSYDELAPWVDRIAAGSPNVLTRQRVRWVEPSGGSSGASKLIPYTDALRAEFSAATLPWIFDLLAHRPALRDGRAYWAVTPPGRRATETEGGVPIGMDHDSDYFPAIARLLLDRVLGTPRALGAAPDVATCRYLTLRALLTLPDLAFISVWSPSFLTLLAGALDEWFDDLVRDLMTGRLSVPLAPVLARRLGRAFPARPSLALSLRRRFGRSAPSDLGALWPRLALISCWTDGHATRALEAMRERFPRVEVQGKGLLATEGVVSFPLFAAEGAVAAVSSHLLEFIPHDDATRAVTVEQLERDRVYEVLLTTSGGLYRYRLRDLVQVDGRFHQTPVLRFVGRADRASDLAGEKLTPAFVDAVIGRAATLTGVQASFAMLAPAWGTPPRYALVVAAAPADAERLARSVEEGLTASHHYALCRSLGQLGPVEAVAAADAESRYERACLARGQRAGAIKPTALATELGWTEHFRETVTAPASPGLPAMRERQLV